MNINSQGTGAQEFWTKEAKRIEQITKKEDDINRYKEMGEWGLVLNALEDYLRFQIEAIEEKGAEGKKKSYGIETQTYQNQMQEILDLESFWNSTQVRTHDPTQKRNNQEERHTLILRIKRMIDKVYHNNILYNLTYRKKADPFEAWKE